MQRISFIVVPVMLIELASALLLAYFFESSLTIILLALVLGIWAITFIFFTNMHQKLTDGYDHSILNKIVKQLESADLDISLFPKKIDQKFIEIDLDNLQIEDNKFDLKKYSILSTIFFTKGDLFSNIITSSLGTIEIYDKTINAISVM